MPFWSMVGLQVIGAEDAEQRAMIAGRVALAKPGRWRILDAHIETVSRITSRDGGVMRKTSLVILGLLAFCAAVAAQAPKATEKDLIGTWTGKYAGGTTGAYEMTITKAADGRLGGSVSPKPDTGDPYTTPFNSIAFADGKATMKCFDPPGEVEITLEATVEGTTLKGEYIVRARADNSEVDRGTFTGTKKAAKN
jgi:hypothetical protein